MKAPIPVQPRDRADVVYRLIDEYLRPGDQKEVAEKLEVTLVAVNRVCQGNARSERIWEAVITKVIKRKEQKQAFLTYMNK
jgi:hypothetical protein